MRPRQNQYEDESKGDRGGDEGEKSGRPKVHRVLRRHLASQRKRERKKRKLKKKMNIGLCARNFEFSKWKVGIKLNKRKFDIEEAVSPSTDENTIIRRLMLRTSSRLIPMQEENQLWDAEDRNNLKRDRIRKNLVSDAHGVRFLEHAS